MEKISLIAWRCRERKHPETEAQRRARARELSQSGPTSSALQAQGPMPFAATLSFDPLDLSQSDWLGAIDPEERVSAERPADEAGETFQAAWDAIVNLDLSPEQRQAIRPLFLLADTRKQKGLPSTFDLAASQDQPGIVLQFSLQPEPVPEMISLKELCRRLKVSRWTATRLMRRGELPSYRVSRGYRFAVADVKRYLERVSVKGLS